MRGRRGSSRASWARGGSSTRAFARARGGGALTCAREHTHRALEVETLHKFEAPQNNPLFRIDGNAVLVAPVAAAGGARITVLAHETRVLSDVRRCVFFRMDKCIDNSLLWPIRFG